MYSVLIVDDEDVIREGLKQVLDWSSLGFTIGTTAANGEQALNELESNHFDVILADVRMPKMSGIELAEIIHRRYPEKRVVILSGYDNFKFAQQAIQYGVYHYLLKPCQEEEITEVFQRLKEELDQHRVKRKSQRDTEKQLLYHEAEEVLQGERDPENSTELLKWLERFSDISAAVLHLWVSPTHSLLMEMWESGQDLLRRVDELELNLFESIDSSRILMVHTQGHQFGGIVCSDQESIQQQTEELFYRLKKELAEKISCELYGAYTIIVPSEGRLVSSHYQALEKAMRELRRRIPGRLIQIDSSMEISSKDIVLPDPRNLVQQICTPQEENSENLSALLDEWKKEFADHRTISVEDLVSWTDSLTAYLQKSLLDCDIDITLRIRHFDRIISLLSSMLTLDALFGLLERLFQDVVAELTERHAERYSKNVRAAIYLINERFGEAIGLEEIAETLSLSGAYLSRLFKRETGSKFSEYLQKRRIAEAKRLLKETNDKVYTIAASVGYPDQHYFSELFKRHTGFTPLEYRRLAPDESRIN